MLDIEDLRRAVIRALIWEIYDKDNGEKVDKLAAKLRKVFARMDDMKVSRPSKMVEIRLTSLDDSYL